MTEQTKKEIKLVLSALYELILTGCAIYCLWFLAWHRYTKTPIDTATASVCVVGILWVMLRNASEERKTTLKALRILTGRRKPKLIDRFGNPADKIDKDGYPID